MARKRYRTEEVPQNLREVEALLVTVIPTFFWETRRATTFLYKYEE